VEPANYEPEILRVRGEAGDEEASHGIARPTASMRGLGRGIRGGGGGARGGGGGGG
jgi:hypothetical protein